MHVAGETTWSRDKWVRQMLSIRRRPLRKPVLVDFIDIERWGIADKWPPFSNSVIDQYCERSSEGSQQNPKHKRNKLTTYVIMADSSKTKALELCVACLKKHPLDKCESIMENSLDEKINIWMSKTYGKRTQCQKLPTTTNLQNLRCLSSSNTPRLFSQSKNRR